LILLISFLTASFSLSLNMAASRDAILSSFKAGNALKIISGINNFDVEVVRKVSAAASLGGASFVDIACDAELIKAAKASSSIPVCVSSIDHQKFVDAVEAGADMVEIGNYDYLYDEGILFSPEDIIRLTKLTRKYLPDIVLSVTIPHTLLLHEQISLAQALEGLGADIIQTEGKMSIKPQGMGVQESIELASPTIASAYAISRAVKIPVMCASGLNDITAPLAIAAGARGVGIGSMVNKLTSISQMTLAVAALSRSLGRKVPDQSSTPAEPISDFAVTACEAVSSVQSKICM